MCFDEICLNWWQSLSVLALISYLAVGIILTARIVITAGPRYDKVEEPFRKHIWSCLMLVLALPGVMFTVFIKSRLTFRKSA